MKSKPTDSIGGECCRRILYEEQGWHSIRRDWQQSDNQGIDGRKKGKQPLRLDGADGSIRQPQQRQQMDSHCCNIPGDDGDDDVAKLRLRDEIERQQRLQQRSLVVAAAVAAVVVVAAVDVDCDDPLLPTRTEQQRWLIGQLVEEK